MNHSQDTLPPDVRAAHRMYDMVTELLGGDGPMARRADPESSHWAADRVSVTASRFAVAQALRIGGPQTDAELEQRLVVPGGTLTPSRLRTARHELEEQGVVEFSGIYRLTRARRRARVWQLVEPDHA